MRRFTDRTGRRWDVVAGRESWGAVFAIFIPQRAGDGDVVVRQAPLEGTGYARATVELDALSEEELRDLLDRSEPKNPA